MGVLLTKVGGRLQRLDKVFRMVTQLADAMHRHGGVGTTLTTDTLTDRQADTDCDRHAGRETVGYSTATAISVHFE